MLTPLKHLTTKNITHGLICSALFFALPTSATTVQFQTVLGDFEVNLYDNKTPETVTNFLAYVNEGDFNDTVFHRSVPNFALQGGGFKVDIEDQFMTMPPVTNEPFFSNQRGTIAMAKLPGNPNSATSQWFFNLKNNTELDGQNGGFTVFGEVMGNGMEVVDALAALPTYRYGNDFPSFPLVNYGPTELDNMTPVVARDHFVIISHVVILDADPGTADDITPTPTTYSPPPKKSGSAFDLWFLLMLGGCFAILRAKQV